MKRFLLLSLVGAILLNAVPTLADDGFYVIAGRYTPGTKITSLPYHITAPGYYYLTRNLTYTGGNGITVSADNVTIDLMSFTLTGSATDNYSGIFTSHNDVELRNGTLTDWLIGINQFAGTGFRAISVRAVGNTYDILLWDNALIKGCTASPGSTTTGYGLFVNSGTISNCTVMDFSLGSTMGQINIGSGRASDNVVINCAGIGIRGLGPTTISNNAVINCSTGIGNEGGGSVTGNAVKANPGQTGIAPATYVNPKPPNIATPSLLDQNSVNGNGTHYGDGNGSTVKGLNSP